MIKILMFCLYAAAFVFFGRGGLPLALAESFLKFGEPPLSAPAGEKAGVPVTFAHLAKELSPAVVNISAEGEPEENRPEESENAPFSKRDPSSPYRSLGSGFIVHEDGYIVTNYHVVEKAERIIVRLLNDKSEYTAQVIGKDLRTDLVLLKISPADKLHHVFLGDSDRLEVGEWVLAIGNQFQLGHTVSAGIVSALARKVRASIANPYEAYIQTDASINPGSSGGPLFNVKGQVIGVNTAIFSPGRSPFGGSGFNIGIGFAIPINLVKGVIVQLKEHGKVTRGLLGVIIQKVDHDIAQILNLPSADGALVADVLDESPASRAGFQRKDVVISYDGKPVRDYDDLPLMVANSKIGSQVRIGLIRDGREQALKVTISELKETAVKSEPPSSPNILGLVVKELHLGAPGKPEKIPASGVLVTFVEPGSPGGRAGVERGDILEEVGGAPVSDAKSLEKILKDIDPAKPLLVLVRKREGSRFLVLKLKKR